MFENKNPKRSFNQTVGLHWGGLTIPKGASANVKGEFTNVTTMVESVSQQPWGVLIAALLFAIAGCVYQLFVQLSPEARDALKQEKKKAKKKLADAKAIENRWTNYSKDKGLD